MTIVIVNPMNDAHCRHMTNRLQELGIDYVELESPLTNDYALLDGVLYYNGKAIRKASSVFYRGVMTHNPEYFLLEDPERYNVQVQFGGRAEAVREWLRIMHLEGAFVINPPSYNSKYHQLYKLRRAGVAVPDTCITASVELAREFARRADGQAVCKPLPGGSFCRRIDESFWASLGDADTFGEPVIFQEEIKGRDVRVNMLEGQVLSAHMIVTSHDDIVDYRTDPNYSDGAITYKQVSLPDEVAEMCDRAMKALGLRFSGIDLRLTPDGRFVLIECNSMPAYLDIERKTSASITDGLIEALRKHSTDAPPEYRAELYELDGGNGTGMSKPVATSLFPYYDVMKKWSEQMLTEQPRIVMPMNEEQQEQFWQETGKRVKMMEVERHGREVRISRVW